MISCGNTILELRCRKDGSGLTLTDRSRGQAWELDEESLVYSRSGQEGWGKLHPVHAGLLREDTVEILFLAGPGGAEGIQVQYRLLADGVEATLSSRMPEDVNAVSLPGSFRPEGGGVKYLLPIMQGMLWDGRGQPFEQRLGEAHHSGFAMAMYGLLGERGGLLVTAETADDGEWWLGKDSGGRTWLTGLQVPSLGRMGYDRKVRLYPTALGIGDIAKAYRRRVMERGRFLSWGEKLEERPALADLFGTAFCFIGYCRDDLDYVAGCRALRDYGFDKAHLFPLRFHTYSRDFHMGGYPPIDLSPEITAQIKELGYSAAPWSWINEGLDDGTPAMARRLRKNREGQNALTWQIDDHKWYVCCSSAMEEFWSKGRAGEFSDMTWDHFDVITCASVGECYALDHPNHPDRPLSKTEDRRWLRQLLTAAQEGGRPVSSESFNDAYSREYDVGSVLAWPQYGPWEFWPVPLSMLVYHDSMLHIWWEAHAYSDPNFGRDNGKYQYGGGRPRLMAAMDALYGNPPLLFPFGAMYGWTGNGSETHLYRMRLGDPMVREAMSQALPVARLHGRIGMLEMVDFAILSGDGYLQRTEYSDGTAVYANFSPVVRYLEGVGSLRGESWIAVKDGTILERSGE